LELGSHSILGHSISRARAAGFFPILCTSTDTSDDCLVAEADKYEVQTFRGNLLNKIQRWNDCISDLGLRDAHIIDGDDPYFDADEMQRSIVNLRENELDLLRTSERSDSGFATVGISIRSAFLLKLAKRASLLPSSDFDVIPWELLIEPSDRVKVATNTYLTEDTSRQIRLTLDYPEDLHLMRKIAERFGYDTPRTEIEAYLVQNPEILRINNSRTEDFLNNKKVQLESNFQIES
jgi:spore coat polysaccharide biosynthesis protein SpsF (cytidylyltransferase family)